MFEGLPIYMCFRAPLSRAFAKHQMVGGLLGFRGDAKGLFKVMLQLVGALKHRPRLPPTFHAKSASAKVWGRVGAGGSPSTGTDFPCRGWLWKEVWGRWPQGRPDGRAWGFTVAGQQ